MWCGMFGSASADPFVPDRIFINQLELMATIGVSVEERARPQRLSATIGVEPVDGFSHLGDRIEAAIDYTAVCEVVNETAMRSDCQLLETLAETICAHLLARFPARRIEIELRKFILPATNFVAVKISRPD